MTYPKLGAQRARKIIILNLPRVEHSDGSRFPSFAMKVLRALGYRFATISEALQGPDERYACLSFEGLRPALARLSVPATLFVCVSELTPPDWLTLRSLKAAGWEIGSSGMAPSNLTDLSYAEQQAAIVEARRILEERLGEAPRIFSYPFGAYDATTVSVVRDAGFDAAVTAARGINGIAEGHPYHLRRLSLAPNSIRDMTSLVKHALIAAPAEANPLLPGTAPSRRRVRSGAVS